MTDKRSLLDLRKRIKAKKPDFLYQDAHKKIALPRKWRRPRGLHSKMRLNKRGYRRKIQIGWKSPALVRGLHPSGYEPILISNVPDLDLLDKEKHGALISNVGRKKRFQILEAALKKGITVLNIKDPKKYLEDHRKKLEEKKAEKKKKEAEKTAKKKKLEQKKKEKKKDTPSARPAVGPEYAAEEKINKEKKEKDKILASK